VTAYIANYGFCEVELRDTIYGLEPLRNTSPLKCEEMIFNSNCEISPVYSEVIGVIDGDKARVNLYKNGTAKTIFWATNKTFLTEWNYV